MPSSYSSRARERACRCAGLPWKRGPTTSAPCGRQPQVGLAKQRRRSLPGQPSRSVRRRASRTHLAPKPTASMTPALAPTAWTQPSATPLLLPSMPPRVVVPSFFRIYGDAGKWCVSTRRAAESSTDTLRSAAWTCIGWRRLQPCLRWRRWIQMPFGFQKASLAVAPWTPATLPWCRGGGRGRSATAGRGVIRPPTGSLGRGPVRRFAAVSAMPCAAASRRGRCAEPQHWPEVEDVTGILHPKDLRESGLLFACEAEAAAAHENALKLRLWKEYEWQYLAPSSAAAEEDAGADSSAPSTLAAAAASPRRPGCFANNLERSLCCFGSSVATMHGAAGRDLGLCWLAERRWRCCAETDSDEKRWLVRRAARRPVGGLGEVHMRRLREALRALRRPAIVVMSSWQALCHYDNFLVHAARHWDGPIITAAFDERSMEWCRRLQGPSLGGLHVECVDLRGLMPEEDTLGVPDAGSTSSNFNANTVFHWIIWMKPLIAVQAALHAKHGVLMLDTDVLLRGDLIGWLHRFADTRRVNLMFGQDPWEAANIGTLFVSRKSLRFVDAWARLANSSEARGGMSDQALFGKCLVELSRLAPLVQMIPANVVGQCGEEGSMATHYNCKLDKTASMLAAGDWIPQSRRCRA
eukprot:TRINITY_DN23679_c0_g1_i2.p1 TRINITY_DN23679_c0_g1~~TRINITY_DN23679_c0_g1_i2.p1  ORF type:complete len:638 (+),score=109.84 TRINITY_DN23679_c0_g1_i2:501-2414(+)